MVLLKGREMLRSKKVAIHATYALNEHRLDDLLHLPYINIKYY